MLLRSRLFKPEYPTNNSDMSNRLPVSNPLSSTVVKLPHSENIPYMFVSKKPYPSSSSYFPCSFFTFSYSYLFPAAPIEFLSPPPLA
jgi:hypothetical protein